MISKIRPKAFVPQVEVATCLLEHDGKILFLLRQEHRPQGNTWSTPGGKLEVGETPEQGLVREVFEETGLTIASKDLELVNVYYVTYPDLQFVYHAFRMQLLEKPTIQLQDAEHRDFSWVTPKAALELSLIPDQDFCIKDIYNLS
jgi:mutator protein MutT